MVLLIKVTVAETATGVNTNIACDGMCTEAEAEMSRFIHDSIVAALKKKPGYKCADAPEVNLTETTVNNEENSNVH